MRISLASIVAPQRYSIQPTRWQLRGLGDMSCDQAKAILASGQGDVATANSVYYGANCYGKAASVTAPAWNPSASAGTTSAFNTPGPCGDGTFNCYVNNITDPVQKQQTLNELRYNYAAANAQAQQGGAIPSHVGYK